MVTVTYGRLSGQEDSAGRLKTSKGNILKVELDSTCRQGIDKDLNFKHPPEVMAKVALK